VTGSEGKTQVTRIAVRGLSAVAALGCVSLTACSTGFGAPTRHATANLQAVAFNLGTNLQIRGAIVAIPTGAIAAKGGVAYVQLTAINVGNQADQLIAVTVDPSVAPTAVASGSETVPANTSTGPGTVRLTYALEPLAKQLRAGDEVDVTLQFANAGTSSTLELPVLAQSSVGSFLPSSPPPVPVSSPPVSSPPASPVAASPVAASPIASAPASPLASPLVSPAAS
jgi:copper(I)-binding protein